MSRVVVTRARGGPEVLEVVDRPPPEPGSGEVRIAVQAAGVAYGDVMRRRGLLRTRGELTPGYDIAGAVDAAGAGVQPGLIGRRFACLMPRPGSGGYAEHVCVPADRLVPIPDATPADVAVALGLNYITAYQMIHRIAELKPGQKILVHGAGGGVGTALLDLGRAAGLEMYGTASAGKHALVRERGATPIDYRSEDFVDRIAALTGDGVDAVFDGIGGAHLRRSHQAVRPGGVLVWYGTTAAAGARDLARHMAVVAALKVRPRGRRLRMYMITVSRGADWRHCRDDWATILAMHRAGDLPDPVIGARVPLAEACRAHELMEAAAVPGKIVLIP